MYVIAVYDISTVEKSGQRRLNKIMKLFRRFFSHMQKSVFEGEISQSNFMKLQAETLEVINDRTDYVLFYRIDNKKNLKKVSLGIDFDPSSNVI